MPSCRLPLASCLPPPAIAWSPHTDFTTGKGAWRFISRLDGKPAFGNTVTLSDGTTTCSPFVALATG